MPTPEFEKNTKEQYEELGRFVEAFEAMVSEVRNTCILILAGLDLDQQMFVSVALHHQALSAKPLIEIMRTLIIEVSKNNNARAKYQIDDEAQTIITGVLGTINKEYGNLANKRNNLLHGTWFIGYTGPEDLDAKEFFVSKLAHTKDGLSHIHMPKNAAELRDLTKRCEKTQAWISDIGMVFLVSAGASDLKHRFFLKENGWVVPKLDGDETLP